MLNNYFELIEFTTKPEDNPYIGLNNLYEIAEKLFLESRFKQSILALEAIVRAEPTNVIALKFLGKIHYEIWNDSLAIACLKVNTVWFGDFIIIGLGSN